jgi:hypothetical protein
MRLHEFHGGKLEVRISSKIEGYSHLRRRIFTSFRYFRSISLKTYTCKTYGLPPFAI